MFFNGEVVGMGCGLFCDIVVDFIDGIFFIVVGW